MDVNLKKTLNGKAKYAVGAVALVLIGAGAFVAGKHRGAKESVAQAETEGPHGKTDEHAAGQTVEKHDRAPASASAPKDGDSHDEERDERDEEIEIQFARKKQPTALVAEAEAGERAGAHGKEKHADAKKRDAEDRDEEKHADAAQGHADGKRAVAEHAAAGHAEEGVSEKHGAPAPAKKSGGFFHRLFGTYADAWDSVQQKVEDIRRLDEDNQRLRLENAHLRVAVENKVYGCRYEEAKKGTQKVGEQLNAATGTRVGRTLASISYQIPENLLPEQLQALAISYFKAKENEKAVTIFDLLTNFQSDDTYKTPDNYLMLGILWYRLENYKEASGYFDRILRYPAKAENRETQVQAKLWSALTANRQKDRRGAQQWLTQALETYPHAKETRWVNPQGGDRRLASSASEEDAKEEKAKPKAQHKDDGHAHGEKESGHH